MKSIAFIILILSIICFYYGSSQRRWGGPITQPKHIREERRKKLDKFIDLMEEAKKKASKILYILNLLCN